MSNIGKTDESLMLVFNDLKVTHSGESKLTAIPCMWASGDDLWNLVLQNKKNTPNLMRLIYVGLNSGDIRIYINKALVEYSLVVLTYSRDLTNQILDQIIAKFDNTKNCKLVNVKRTVEENDGFKVYKSVVSLTVAGIGVPVETRK